MDFGTAAKDDHDETKGDEELRIADFAVPAVHTSAGSEGSWSLDRGQHWNGSVAVMQMVKEEEHLAEGWRQERKNIP